MCPVILEIEFLQHETPILRFMVQRIVFTVGRFFFFFAFYTSKLQGGVSIRIKKEKKKQQQQLVISISMSISHIYMSHSKQLPAN